MRLDNSERDDEGGGATAAPVRTVHNCLVVGLFLNWRTIIGQRAVSITDTAMVWTPD